MDASPDPQSSVLNASIPNRKLNTLKWLIGIGFFLCLAPFILTLFICSLAGLGNAGGAYGCGDIIIIFAPAIPVGILFLLIGGIWSAAIAKVKWFDTKEFKDIASLTPDQILYIKSPSMAFVGIFNAVAREHWDLIFTSIGGTFILSSVSGMLFSHVIMNSLIASNGPSPSRSLWCSLCPYYL
jgi:hypothetical protein